LQENEVTINDAVCPESIIILGAPGSGKDTQAEFLADTLGYQIISTGQLARILAGHNDQVHEMMKKGELIPDSIIEDELISAFILLPEAQPVILDGYPRNIDQAKKLESILTQNNRKLDKVIYITVDDKEIVKRLEKRRVCSACGFLTNSSQKSCPECGGKLIQREDDKPESIKNRIKVFHDQTEPMIEYYKKAGILAEIDGNPTPDKVKEEIKEAL
jgi:adenylate kinase